MESYWIINYSQLRYEVELSSGVIKWEQNSSWNECTRVRVKLVVSVAVALVRKVLVATLVLLGTKILN